MTPFRTVYVKVGKHACLGTPVEKSKDAGTTDGSLSPFEENETAPLRETMTVNREEACSLESIFGADNLGG